MTTTPEAVPLLVQRFKDAPLGSQRWSLAALELHEALMTSAAVAIPESSRVDVETIRTITSDMKESEHGSIRGYAKLIEAALPAKVEE